MSKPAVGREAVPKYTVEIEIDEGNGTPIVSGPYDTEVAASAYVDETAADSPGRVEKARSW